MQLRLKREPHAQQLAFINSSAREQLYGGAKRGGKSVALCMKIILLSVLFPGNRILLARKDFTDLQDTTLTEFWQTCPTELLDTKYGNGTGHNKGERTIRLKTVKEGVTSDILYRGLGAPEDIEKCKGLNISAFALDEPSEIDYETFKMLNAQLTWTLPDGSRPPYMALLGCNPEPGWVKTRYIDEPVPGSVFIPSLPRQNPFLPPGWETELRMSYDEEWVNKYLDGSWMVTEGSVFPELDDRIHAIEPIDTRGLTLVAAIDHASTGTTSMVIDACDANDNLFTVAEYYEKDRLISAHAASMLELMAQFTPAPRDKGEIPQKFRYVLIDPATSQRTLQGTNQLQSIQDEYIKYGIHTVPAWNALEKGLNSIKERLRVDPLHAHPLKPLVGAPHMYIVKQRCRNLWREMRELRKKYTPSGKIIFLGSDHALDCKRYIENSRPPLPKISDSDINRMGGLARLGYNSHKKFMDTWGKTSAGRWNPAGARV